MIKRYKWTLIAASIITLLPILVGVIFWDRLPENMATHFGVDNNADGWNSKWVAVFVLPLLLAVLEWVCVFVTSHDPKSKNISGKAMGVVLWIIPVISLVANSTVYTYALGLRLDIGRVMMILFGIIAIIVGNYLPKSSQNFSMGIKISWTLNDEENWNHTHRFAGRLWVLCGVVMLLFSVFRFVWLFFAVVLIMVLAPIIYSYCYYKKHKEQ